ncbi:uncharacterized protein [Dysidea avara]|uniref:uncharacterized protein isoform X3 n=1 Tax=Dysidea avara TaxID=196820 RepID=UPI003318DFB6
MLCKSQQEIINDLNNSDDPVAAQPTSDSGENLFFGRKSQAEVINDHNNHPVPSQLMSGASTSGDNCAIWCKRYSLKHVNYNSVVVSGDGLKRFLLSVLLCFVNWVVSRLPCVKEIALVITCHEPVLLNKIESYRYVIQLELGVFAVSCDVALSYWTVKEDVFMSEASCVKNAYAPSVSMLLLHCCMLCLMYYRYCVSCLMYYWYCGEEFCTFWRGLSRYYLLQQLTCGPACTKLKHLLCNSYKNIVFTFMRWSWLYGHFINSGGYRICSKSGNSAAKGNGSKGGSSSGNGKCTSSTNGGSVRTSRNRLAGNSGRIGSCGGDDGDDDGDKNPNQRPEYAYTCPTAIEYEEDSTTEDHNEISSTGSALTSNQTSERLFNHGPVEFTLPVSGTEAYAFAATSPMKGGPPVLDDVQQLYPAEIAPQTPTCDISYSPSQGCYESYTDMLLCTKEERRTPGNLRHLCRPFHYCETLCTQESVQPHESPLPRNIEVLHMTQLFPGLNEVKDVDFKNTLMALCTIIAGVIHPLYCPSDYGYYYYFYLKDIDVDNIFVTKNCDTGLVDSVSIHAMLHGIDQNLDTVKRETNERLSLLTDNICRPYTQY